MKIQEATLLTTQEVVEKLKEKGIAVSDSSIRRKSEVVDYLEENLK